MPRFKVKTNTLVTEVDSQEQLRHFAETGVCAPDSLVKHLPDGSWTRAHQHPALRGLHWPARDPDTGDLVPRTAAPAPRAVPPRPLAYDGGNLSIKLFQAILLVCTCFLWTFGAGWIVIFELAPPRHP